MGNHKVLMITFSVNADHQDTLFGMYELLSQDNDTFLLTSESLKVPLNVSDRTWLIKCPMLPGFCKDTFKLKPLINSIKKLKAEKIDRIYFESLHIWNVPILVYAAFHKKLKTFQVIHDIIPHDSGAKAKLIILMNKIVCKLSDIIIIRNEKYKQELINKYHIEESRVQVIDLWRRFPAFNQPNFSGEMLLFGRINPYKGLDNFIDIVKNCNEIKFRIVGTINQKFQKQINELALFPNVSIVNRYVTDDEMRNYFIMSDWILVPYNSASQSGVIIDAYKYSRPVIAFKVGAIEEQVEDGLSGFLVDNNDIKMFSDVLKRVNSFSKEKLLQISKNAFEYGYKKYSVTNAKEKIQKLLFDD